MHLHLPFLCASQFPQLTWSIASLSALKLLHDSVTTVETWTKFTQNNIARSHAERDASEELRSDIDCFLRTACKEMWHRFNSANSALITRIQETTNARNRLQIQLEKVC